MNKRSKAGAAAILAVLLTFPAMTVCAETTTAPTETTQTTTTTGTDGTLTSDPATETTTTTTTTTAAPQHTDQVSRFTFRRLENGTLAVESFRWETDEETVVVPSRMDGLDVTAIDPEAFRYCYASTVMLPQGIVSIGESAFEGCAWMTTLEIPSSCVEIGARAFAECKRLEKVNLPPTVQRIGAAAFDGTPYIDNQTGDLIVLAGDILYLCRGTETAVTVPAAVKTIGAYAFAGCDAIESLVLPPTVENILEGAFNGCTELAEITFPETFTELAPDALDGTKWLARQRDTAVIGNLLYRWNGKNGTLEVPDGVEIINTAACRDCTALTTVKLPDSVRTIRGEAFAGCTSLQVFTAEQLRVVGERAFSGCTTLKYLRLGHQLTEIGAAAFLDCPRLEEYYLPDTLALIGDHAIGYGASTENAAFTPIRNVITLYANAPAAKEYAAANDLQRQPLPDEENTDLPPAVTTEKGKGYEVGSPMGKAWMPAAILGGLLVLIGLIGWATRRRG